MTVAVWSKLYVCVSVSLPVASYPPSCSACAPRVFAHELAFETGTLGAAAHCHQFSSEVILDFSGSVTDSVAGLAAVRLNLCVSQGGSLLRKFEAKTFHCSLVVIQHTNDVTAHGNYFVQGLVFMQKNFLPTEKNSQLEKQFDLVLRLDVILYRFHQCTSHQTVWRKEFALATC